MRVDSSSVSNLFVVKESGKVGIGGVQNPSAMVDIEQVDSGDDLLVFKDTSGTQLFIVDETGKVGIGTDETETLTSLMTVSGDLKAVNGYFTSIDAESIRIGDGFSINASGNISLGSVDLLNTGLFISKTFDSQASSHTAEKIELIVNEPLLAQGDGLTYTFTNDLKL